MRPVRITKALVGHGTLSSGPGYVSNMHWLIRQRLVVGQKLKFEHRYKTPASRIVKGGRRRYIVRRTSEVRELGPWAVGGKCYAVLFTGRKGRLRVWVNEPYAALLGEVAYAASDSDAVVDRATRWNVAVMPMRVE